MAGCGGLITTQKITVGKAPQQLYGALEARVRAILRADPNNTGVLYISSGGQNTTDGFLVFPGEGIELTKEGCRAALYAYAGTLDDGPATATVYVLTEGLLP